MSQIPYILAAIDAHKKFQPNWSLFKISHFMYRVHKVGIAHPDPRMEYPVNPGILAGQQKLVKQPNISDKLVIITVNLILTR